MSNSFESINKIDIYEKNGLKIEGIDKPKLIVKEDWLQKIFVVLEINDIKIKVVASELKRAIDNAQNTHP